MGIAAIVTTGRRHDERSSLSPQNRTSTSTSTSTSTGVGVGKGHAAMKHIAAISLLVPDCDEAIHFFTAALR
jgi:hypothetical protein